MKINNAYFVENLLFLKYGGVRQTTRLVMVLGMELMKHTGTIRTGVLTGVEKEY